MSFETPIVPLEDDHLFEIARNRMAHRPGELIDLSYWENKVSILSFHEDSRLSFRFGPYRVSAANHRLVPAFAAMSHGITGKFLGDVLHHHGADFDQITTIYYEITDVILSASYVEVPEETARDEQWIFSTLMNAVCEHPDLAKGLRPASEYLCLNPVIDLALLKAPFEHLWPITKMGRYVKIRKAGDFPANESYHPRPLAIFSNSQQKLDEETDEQILKLLHRAGVLLHVPEAEFNLNLKFFHRFFEQMIESPSKNIEAICRALNSIEDTALLKEVNAMIIQSLSNNEFFDDAERYDIVQATLKMDPVKYGVLRESWVLRLNILPLEDAAMVADPQGDTYLQRLHNELMDVHPSEFRAHHFTSLANLARHCRRPQSINDINWCKFFEHILSGLEHQQNLALKDESPSRVFLQAADDAGAFVLYASKTTTHDYASLNDLPSSSKAFLAANGFDIKKLPGISNKHRGQLLSTEMGL